MQDEYTYAVRIASYMWETYYKNVAPEWEPLNDLLGVLTQIDNMIAGMNQEFDDNLPLINR